jgi:hypothetical protein
MYDYAYDVTILVWSRNNMTVSHPYRVPHCSIVPITTPLSFGNVRGNHPLLQHALH